jgi:hypothetical protein
MSVRAKERKAVASAAPVKAAPTKQVPSSGPAYLEIPPNAAKTLYALREMGYNSFDSVMDIVDNSIDADATKVSIQVKEAGKGNIVIDILDNGVGMDDKVLAEALRLGSDVEHNPASDLGKFGMGLVTASISMAKSVWVLTRKKGAIGYEADFDLDTIARENRFIITLKPAKSDKVLKQLYEQGTLVRLSSIDRISDTNVARFAANLRDKLGQVYRHFLDKGVAILVNNRAVKKIDPLMLDHELTEVVFEDTLTLDRGKTASLKVVELPELGQQGDVEANITPHNSGFYVVRNGREIMEAQTFGFYQRHHSYSRFRAELSFTGDLDEYFHVDIRKSIIHPDDRLLDKLRQKTEKLVAQAGRRGRENNNVPMKLTHKAADAINAALPAVLGRPLPPPAAPEGTKLAQVTEDEKKDVQKKAGKKLDIVEEDKKAQAVAEAPPARPQVTFGEADLGDTARFFQSEVKPDGAVAITYNTRHPFIRSVGEIKNRQAHGLVDFMAFALARAESEIAGGNKVVNKVCDVLKALSTPQTAG